MDTFVRVGDHSPLIGITDLSPLHCSIVSALTRHTTLREGAPKDVRGTYRSALEEVRKKQVTVLPELRRVGPVEAESYLPNLMLQEIAHDPANPSRIEIPSKYTLDAIHTWRHRTLVQHLYSDRLYQSSDSDLADPRRILILTLGRAGEITGSAFTPNHDRPFLLALYAATIELEAEMRSRHPRFAAHILGAGTVNRHRLRVYTNALDFLKNHIENLLRATHV